MGVRKRRSTLTKASVSFVLRSLVILRTGISGWRIPIVNGSRAGLACPNTSSSHRLRVSPRNASSSNSIEKVAWSSIGCGQSRAGSKYWGGPFLRACFFLRCEDQKSAPSLSYLYVVCDKKGSLLLGCDLGKAPD